MFPIDFSVFFCYYLSVFFVVFLGVWFLGRSPFSRRKALLQAHQIWQCSVCTYVYFESRNLKISTCPLCGSFNKKS